MTSSEEIYKKLSAVQQDSAPPTFRPLGKSVSSVPPINESLITPLEPERTYVFPSGNLTNSTATIISTARGHSRSVSHGGGSIPTPIGRPLKSAIKGHQRALSHGQIVDSPQTILTRGHSRVGSKTDFILPPGHKEEEKNRPSAQTGAGGHSRQASRSESIYTLRRAERAAWWKKLTICSRKKPAEYNYRIVVCNHTIAKKTPKRDHPNSLFVGNKIRTTKYTFLSFIPKNLLEQFHRVANLYFIFIVLLNWFPAINAFGKEVAMIPVLFVLGVTAIKDLFEDRRRRHSDKRINKRICSVFDGEIQRYKKIKWQEVAVGDIIQLSNNETVPADILLLRTSNPHGVCYIDTCDLDGETNLKRREVVHGFLDKQIEFSANKFVSRVEADAPTTKLYRFHGAVIHPSGQRVPISTENLLLRESRLKNTEFVEGFVVYAGHETKSMLNNSGPRYKRSQVEQQMNIDVIWCVIILLILCVIGAIGCKMWLSGFNKFPVPYLPFEVNPDYEGLLTFWTYIIILQVMIPLSLYVTIEVCKILQVYHIHNNIGLFDHETNKKTECRAMNITEELGQIQHIFSDKTGTLTENKMIFRRCTINGNDYNHPAFEMEQGHIKPGSPIPPIVPNPDLIDEIEMINSRECISGNAQRIQDFLLVLAICNTVIVSARPKPATMNTCEVIDGRQYPKHNLSTNSKTKAAIISPNVGPISISADRYIKLHESRSMTPSPPPNLVFTLPTKKNIPLVNNSEESTPISDNQAMDMERKRFKCLSPSVRAKDLINSKFKTISTYLNAKTPVKLKNKFTQYKLQNEVKTESARPLYEAESPDELALVNAAYSYDCCLINRSPKHILVKSPGSETVEYEVLKVLPFDSSRKCMSIVVRKTGSQEIILYCKGADSSIFPVLSVCAPHSVEAMLKVKTQQQLDVYARQGLRILVMAKRNLDAGEYTEWWAKHQEIEMSIENRERRIRESYSKLESNLILLGATGIEDRLQEGVPETISSLLYAGIAVWVLTGDKPETAINVAYSAKLFNSQMELIRLAARSRDAAESAIMFNLSEIETRRNDYEINTRQKPKALVVDGKTLTFILDVRANLTRSFLKLAKNCAAVLCCRSTPLQKAFLVKIVKEELHICTLAIGDGANDVSMIQMADVGIGISGQEGMQAVMAADFTLARFKYLESLLLVHGYWCYDRLARMILYFFYKNAAFVFLLFWFQLYCGFSGSVMIDQMYLMLYNLVFTSLPPIAIGVYDKRVPEDLLLRHPYLYKYGRAGAAYKPHDFWVILLDALYQSLVIFFITEKAYWDSDTGIWEFGTTITACCLFTNLIHGAIEIRSWTILHLLSILISLASFYLFSFIYNSLCVNCFGLPSSYWVIFRCISTSIHWFVILLSSVASSLPRLLLTTLKTSVYPDAGTNVIMQNKRALTRGEELLVTWSRSTSASSIYRISNSGSKVQVITSIT